MNARTLIPLATAGALAVFGAQAAASVAGAREGTLAGTGVKIAGAALGIFLASKIAK